MILQVDFSSEEPIYQQIRAQVIQAVAAGELSAGDSLPSVRALAVDLGVNMHTVNKAYAVLRDEGYVVMRGRRGALIADRGVAEADGSESFGKEKLSHALDRLLVEHKAQGGSAEAFEALVAERVAAVYGESSSRKGEEE